MRENYRNSIASIKKFPQFTTMNVIDGQAGLVIYASLIFYSLTVDNILNIIVLLILAGISIQMLTGDNGIIKRAGEAKETTDIAEIKERINLKMAEALINYYTPSSNPAEDNKTDIIKKIVTDLANEYTDGDITGKEKENDDYKIAIEGDGEGAARFHEAGPGEEARQVLHHRRHQAGQAGRHGRTHQHHHAGRVLQAG